MECFSLPAQVMRNLSIATCWLESENFVSLRARHCDVVTTSPDVELLDTIYNDSVVTTRKCRRKLRWSQAECSIFQLHNQPADVKLIWSWCAFQLQTQPADVKLIWSWIWITHFSFRISWLKWSWCFSWSVSQLHSQLGWTETEWDSASVSACCFEAELKSILLGAQLGWN